MIDIDQIAKEAAWEYERRCMDGRMHERKTLIEIIKFAIEEALSVQGEKLVLLPKALPRKSNV